MKVITEQLNITNLKLFVHMIIQKGQLLIILFDQEQQAFQNLYVGAQTQYDQLPLVIKVQDESTREDDQLIENLTKVLSNLYLFYYSSAKKLNLQVFLSYNFNSIPLTPEFSNQLKNQITSIIDKNIKNI